MKELKGRVAVVTGAASGIGRGLAEIFVGADMKVVLADIDKSELEATVKTFEDSGADVIGVPTDVSQSDQVKELAAKAMDKFGAVHVLCNNAGVGYGGRNSWDAPIEAWKWVIDVNDFNNYIEPRFTNILSSKNPAPLEIPQEFLNIVQEIMNQ